MKFLFEQSNIIYLKKCTFSFLWRRMYTPGFLLALIAFSHRGIFWTRQGRKSSLRRTYFHQSARFRWNPRVFFRASFIWHTKASSSLISLYFLVLHSIEYLPLFVVARARFHLLVPLLFLFCFLYRDINRFDFTIGTHKVYEDANFARLRRFAHACQAIVR